MPSVFGFIFHVLQCFVCRCPGQTASRESEALLQQGKVQRYIPSTSMQSISGKSYIC